MSLRVDACPYPLVCPLDVNFLYTLQPGPLPTCRIPITRVRVIALTFWLFAAGWQHGEGVWTSMVQARAVQASFGTSAGHHLRLAGASKQ